MKLLCLDIGGSAIKAGFVDGAGNAQMLERLPTPRESLSDFIATIEGLDKKYNPLGAPIGLSVAAVSDPKSEKVTAANIPCIHGQQLSSVLKNAIATKITIANDADCFALAEAQFGAGKGHALVFGIILGTGIGGGIIYDGKIITGNGGFGGEWGHGPVSILHDQSGKLLTPFDCACGQKGCLDTIGGARGLERLHQTFHGEELDSMQIIENWQNSNPKAVTTIDFWLEALSGPLAMLLNTLGAKVVPSGGGLSNSHVLLAALDQSVRSKMLATSDVAIIVPAMCKIEPGLIGASIVARKILEDFKKVGN